MTSIPRWISIVTSLLVLISHRTQAQKIGGSSSVTNLMNEFIGEFNQGSGIDVLPYMGVTSSKGISGFISGTYDMAVSDVPLSASDESKLKSLKRTTATLPLSLATFSVISSKPGLSIRATDLAKIYLGQIVKWEKIPNSNLKGDIVPIMLNHESGATQVLTKYLFKASKGIWPKKFVGPGPFVTGNKNLKLVSWGSAMAKACAGNALSIGYIQTGFTFGYMLFEVAMTNADNVQITAQKSSVYEAVPGNLPGPYGSWKNIDLVFKNGPTTPPMASFSFIFAKNSYKGKNYCSTLKNFLLFVMGDKGQGILRIQRYNLLPSALRNNNINTIKKISC